MNHLCNSHCEFCGEDIQTLHEEDGVEAFFAITLIRTTGKVPEVIDYGFQQDFSCSLCTACAIDLLKSDRATYSWKRCHCCGADTADEDISAFRIVELGITGLEEHIYKKDPYVFISGTTQTRGPVGYTVCMACVAPEIPVANNTHTGHEMLRSVIEEAVEEGDVYEEFLDIIQ